MADVLQRDYNTYSLLLLYLARFFKMKSSKCYFLEFVDRSIFFDLSSCKYPNIVINSVFAVDDEKNIEVLHSLY